MIIARRKLFFILSLTLTASVLAACSYTESGDTADDDTSDDDADDDSSIEPTYGYAVWPDETGADVLSEWYPFFTELGAELYIKVVEEDIISRNPDIARIFLEAAEAGVHVRPYIILPYEAGIYPNESNFERFFDDTKAMIEWVEDESLPVNWIGVDMETPVQMVMELESYLKEFKFFDALRFLQDHVDPIRFSQSIANYRELVNYCHERKFKVHVISFPFVLDDYSDYDRNLQDAFEVPVSGIDWDEVDFMVYRTMYQGYTGMTFTSDLVYRYALLAKKIFEERASIFIGLVLWPGWFDGDVGYQNPSDLEADIEAALAAGVSRIHIFYLTGLLAKDDPEAWMNPDVSNYNIPEKDPFTTMFVDFAMPIFDLLL